MKIIPRVPGGISLMAIWYKYSSIKVLCFISNEWGGITEPGYPYLSCFPEIYSNVSVLSAVSTPLLGRYFNVCNTIYNHNRMSKYDLAIEEYWVIQSGYFRLATTAALGMGMTYGKLLFCHGIWEESVEKTI